MESNKALPDGYMTVGEVAKKMGVTVRTLQYYDKQGLLCPSCASEGGRRLYTDKDVVLLHQILSMKHLGFSLDDIKNRLIALETPADVAQVLEDQAAAIRDKIDSLSESLADIETLKAEVLQMQSVNFKAYADIITNLQMKNEFYWLIKHFDEKTLDFIRGRFDRESAFVMMDTFKHLQDEAMQLAAQGVAPDSAQGIAHAKAFWEMIMEFTGGDMSLLPMLMELGNRIGTDRKGVKSQEIVKTFSEPAMDAYLKTLHYEPLEELE